MSRIQTLGRRLSARNWRLSGHVPPTSLLDVDLNEDAPPPPPKPPATPTPEQWRRHRDAIREAFPEGWSPARKLSRDAMDGLRSLHALDGHTFSCAVLADRFKISPEAVRRILRSKWEPSKEKRARLAERERRSREDWIAGQRHEEKERAAQILAETRPRPARVRSTDKLFFK